MTDAYTELGIEIDDLITRRYPGEPEQLSAKDLANILSVLVALIITYSRSVPDLKRRRELIDAIVRVTSKHALDGGVLQ